MGIIKEDEQKEKRLFTYLQLRSLCHFGALFEMQLQMSSQYNEFFTPEQKIDELEEKIQEVVDCFWNCAEKPK